jgi:hypothetical protein
MNLRATAFLFALIASSPTAFGQQAKMFAPTLDVGDPVTIQGCVEQAANSNAFILTNTKQWPVLPSPEGKFGLRHFWTGNLPIDLSTMVGHMLQVDGKVASIHKSEIELEPGVRTYGKYVEVERPHLNVLVNPEQVGIDPTRRPERADVPLTLVEVRVEKVLSVRPQCLGTM